MRISLSTPSYETLAPPWDQQRNVPDGSFLEYGGRAINRWDYRITHVVTSELPRSLVSIVGRALRPKQRFADFLSIRIGANTPKFFPLNSTQTLQIGISADGKIHSSTVQVTQDEFMKSWGDTLSSLTDNNFKVAHGALTIAT